MLRFATIITALGLWAGSAAAQPALPDVVSTFETDMGYHFTTKEGRTLYVYSGDETPLKSSCNGVCEKTWPPLAASEGAQPVGDWVVIKRADGASQWAYKGSPVYAYSLDTQNGAVLGDGVLNVWHIAIALKPRPPGVKYYGTVRGRVAADPAAKTLYVRDSGDCVKECLKTWKPFLAPSAALAQGDWSVVTRKDDQSPQWAWHGKPVYTYLNDVRFGDTRGDGIDKVWHAAFVQPAPPVPGWVTVTPSDYGPIFADQNGLTLYSVGDLVRARTEATCNDDCVKANVIPILAKPEEAGMGNWSLITLADGGKQWAYRSQPVYRYIRDKKAGDIFGDKFGLGGGAQTSAWKVMPQESIKGEPL